MSIDEQTSNASGTSSSVPNVINERITQLKPPGQLDLDSTRLASKWRRWKEEIELYMDLAMNGKGEQTKTKLFLYLIGSKGREIYETMKFEAPPQDRTLQQVIAAFDSYCNPKKNETVERYKFFMRVQDTSEPLEQFITDLKLLAASCNFGSLKESLVRDRIICGIRDKQLREELLKDPNLDLERCLNVCRVAELSKERRKALEDGENINLVRQKWKSNKSTQAVKPKFDKRDIEKNRECKYCGRRHEGQREKCPAFGKKCLKCSKMNHFAKKCLAKSKVNAITMESNSDADDDEYCLIINSNVEYEIINNHSVKEQKSQKKLFATFHVEGKPAKFQLDSGATCNVIPVDLLADKRKLNSTRKVLAMYNNTIVKPLGQCRLALTNPRNAIEYDVDFVVVDGNVLIQDGHPIAYASRALTEVETRYAQI